MQINHIKMSLSVIMLLSSSVQAGKIVTNANLSDIVVTEHQQYGFGGWNLQNVTVKIVSTDDFSTLLPESFFDTNTGAYSPMNFGMSFESEISTEGVLRGLLHGKNWPIGEPSGIKVIDGDKADHGKPGNCILTSSYLSIDDNPAGVNGYLDGSTPAPTLCSSSFQTHKRFKLNMMPATLEGINPGEYGKPIDLVFNLQSGDTTTLRYQVLQKINNYTGKRLDGYMIEVLDATGNPNSELTLSVGLGENEGKDIWEPEDMANFSHGLWGPMDDHFPTDGFFDSKRAGFLVSGHDTTSLVGGPATLGSNYVDLFGSWLPSKWQPIGIFFDDDNDPLTDAQLVAFWGDPLKSRTNAWHKGKADNWAEPTDEELLTWTTNPLYQEGHIEDTLNLGLNYIVNVGSNVAIGSVFTIRIKPHIAADQTAPSYIDGNGDYIEPPTSYVTSKGVVTISPVPTFTPGTPVYIGVADADLNTDIATQQSVSLTVRSDTGDNETVTLVETEANSAIFAATLVTQNSATSPVPNDGIISVIEDTVVTATYIDAHYGDEGTSLTLSASTVAKTPVAPTLPNASDGGGCSYNPKSRSVDTTLLLMLLTGLLYPFRRRFIK